MSCRDFVFCLRASKQQPSESSAFNLLRLFSISPSEELHLNLSLLFLFWDPLLYSLILYVWFLFDFYLILTTYLECVFSPPKGIHTPPHIDFTMQYLYKKTSCGGNFLRMNIFLILRNAHILYREWTCDWNTAISHRALFFSIAILLKML